MLTRRAKRAGFVGLGLAVLACLAAWSARPEPRRQWEHGELRAAMNVIDIRFARAAEIECFFPPRELRGSVERSKMFYLDWLGSVGWELIDVSRTDRDWVYLMRRARGSNP